MTRSDLEQDLSLLWVTRLPRVGHVVGREIDKIHDEAASLGVKFAELHRRKADVLAAIRESHTQEEIQIAASYSL